jgi:biopolymer transport protein ExbB
MHRKILLALALLAAVIVTMNVSAQAQQPAPVVTPAATQAAALEDNPYADVLTFDGFVKRTGVMAYPLIGLSMIAFFMIVLFTFTVRQGTVVSDAFMNSADALIRKQDYLGPAGRVQPPQRVHRPYHGEDAGFCHAQSDGEL